jgi:3-hydroxyisobutyrate dehydrogenase
MFAGDFSPQFPIHLMAKDLAYVLRAAGISSAALTIAVAHQVFEAAVARGLGSLIMTGVVQLMVD